MIDFIPPGAMGPPKRDREVVRAWFLIVPDYCMACGCERHQTPWPKGFQAHHIIKSGRSDEPCNLFKCCADCHGAAEGLHIVRNGVRLPTLSLGACLTLKRALDPTHWWPDRLHALRARPLPDLAAPPDWFLDRFLENRGRDLRKEIDAMLAK